MPAGADLETIKRAVAPVLRRVAGDEIRLGTAFFVGGRFAVTALHVVADVRASQPVFYDALVLAFGAHRTEARVVPELWDARGDWAVLECTSPPPVPPITRRAAPDIGRQWDSFAYPDFQPEGKTLKGEVRDPHARFRSTDAIELSCREAESGLGARLHGASGAPCLIDGEAIGLLRSTLVEQIVDGQGRTQVFTQAGTVYACPASSIVDWQADRARSILTGTWAPSPIAANDFVVFLSEAESAPDAYRLEPTVERAYELISEMGLSAPAFISAADAIGTEGALLDAVRALCHARVVIFDATNFEPAIMLLAGIRAVVRRGVTILSIGGQYAVGSQLDIPFNVTDANVVAHSAEQDRSQGKNSVALLTDRLRGGLQDVTSPYYLDLPVYDALRRLPPDRRGIIASDEGVLVLCSFATDYLARVWKERLREGLQHQLGRLQRGKRLDGTELGVARSLDISSSRLVSQALFETIRRAQSCVADLTNWPSNVLFELGVRLAASGERTACLIQAGWEQSVSTSMLPQCQALVRLLVPDHHVYNPKRRWMEEPAFAKVYGPDAVKSTGVLGGSVHTAVEHALDITNEPAARPVYRELLDSAELFSRPPGKGGRSKPVGLYPGHKDLPGKEEEAEFERLVGAWYYVNHRYPQRPATGPLADAAAGIAQSISQRHSERLAALSEVETAEIKRIARLAALAAPPPRTLDEIRHTKLWATAMRNLKELDASMKLLEDASAVLQRMLADVSADPTLIVEVRLELADTFGMKGGVFRRMGKLHEAYEEYKKGEALEKIDQQSTYNLSNVIALGVTQERISPLDEVMAQSIDDAITQLERKTSGTRTDEWWAWSDLGQLYLLKGNSIRAAESYERARKTGPNAEEYQRHVVMLNQVYTVTSDTAPDVARAIRVILSDLSGGALPKV